MKLLCLCFLLSGCAFYGQPKPYELHSEELASANQARELAEKTQQHGDYAKVVIYPETGSYIPVETREKEIAPFLRRAFGLNILPNP